MANAEDGWLTMDDRRTVLIPGSAEGVRRAADELGAFAVAYHLPAGATWPFQVALDELLSNIVRHAHGGNEERTVEVRFGLQGGVLELTVSDDAAPFNPLAAPEPDTARSAEDKPVGGLGIHLVRKLMDEVEYERREGRNVLVCRKRVEA